MRRHVIYEKSKNGLRSHEKSDSQASKSQVDLAFGISADVYTGNLRCIYRDFCVDISGESIFIIRNFFGGRIRRDEGSESI